MSDKIINTLYSLFKTGAAICTDSRTLLQGDIFFALKGDNFNGNEYATKAIKHGAVCAIIDDQKFQETDQYILVNDVLTCLQQLALHHRNKLSIPVIGITGSNGKTSSKELIRDVLSIKYNVLATKGNFNNHIGVPLTLLSITKEHKIAIVEMGANAPGEIADLCELSKPNYGLITNVDKAHLEGFGSMDSIIKTKKELYDYVDGQKGVIFTNHDNEILRTMSAGIDKITYGTENADYVGHIISSDTYLDIQVTGKDSILIKTRLSGTYNFENIMSAVAIGQHFKVSMSNIKSAIENYIPSNNRSQIIKQNSTTIFLDAYNANPASMKASIESFMSNSHKEKLVIIGDMLELGKYSKAEHQGIVDLLVQHQVKDAILIGQNFSQTNSPQHYKKSKNTKTATKYLTDLNLEETAILIKGSRGLKLEELVEHLH